MPTNPGSRLAICALLTCASLLLGACATVDTTVDSPIESTADEPEPVFVPENAVAEADRDAAAGVAPEVAVDEPARPDAAESKPEAKEPAPAAEADAADRLADVVVQAKPRARQEAIRDLVAEAKTLLRDVELRYAFTGRGRRETLRGRPVAFALWSDATAKWTVAHLEIPRPPIRWKPGGRPLAFTVRTPGIVARHIKGTGAERLMFSFHRGDEALKVYGRKFPVFDNGLLAKKRWRAAVASARPIVYLPFTADTFDPLLVQDGREFLLATARRAIDELRAAGAPSSAYPGTLLADVVPAEVIATLAVIEQTDDLDYTLKKAAAFDEVLNQYGLKRDEAYRYSVSRAGAVGPMQFTNRRRNGTYSLVVRRCPAARLDPVFERGATDLLNAMKAAICLFDIELRQMPAAIRVAYRDNQAVLGIFPVAAYNGGPRNVARLRRVIERMNLDLRDLRPPGEQPRDRPVPCPCLWTVAPGGVRPVSIPRYNNENRWYVEKYQSILHSFSGPAGPVQTQPAK